MRNRYSLMTIDFNVHVAADDAIRVDARFVIPINGHEKAEIIAETLHAIGMRLCQPGGIEMVKSDSGHPRCFYCGVKNEKDTGVCQSCGAPL